MQNIKISKYRNIETSIYRARPFGREDCPGWLVQEQAIAVPTSLDDDTHTIQHGGEDFLS